ncbi:MAG: MauE/DoxX family redox-associated membrane protein [Pseudomonadota bacterium]
MNLPLPIALSISWFFLWLFSMSAYHKFSAPVYYEQLTSRYMPSLPSGKGPVMALALFESAIAVALILPESRAAATLVAAVLLACYALLMTLEMLRGRSGLQCGCAGPDSELGLSWALVARNMVCVAAALLALTANFSQSIGWLGYLLAGFVALFIALVYLTVEQIISNAQWMAGEA